MSGIRVGVLVALQAGIFASLGLLLGNLPGLILALGVAAVAIAITSAALRTSLLGSPEVRGADPVSEAALIIALHELARRARIPISQLYVPEHDEPNAFALGYTVAGSAIIVTSGLLRELDNEQVAAVLAHEVAHIRRHDLKLMTVVVATTAILTGIAGLVLVIGRGMRSGGSLPMTVLGWITAIAALVLGFAIGRETEYEADEVAADLCGHPEWLIAALRTLGNVSAARVATVAAFSPALVPILFIDTTTVHSIFSFHPPVQNRIARLESIMERERSGRMRIT